MKNNNEPQTNKDPFINTICVFCGRASLDIYFRFNKLPGLFLFLHTDKQIEIQEAKKGRLIRIFLGECLLVILKNVQPRIHIKPQTWVQKRFTEKKTF